MSCRAGRWVMGALLSLAACGHAGRTDEERRLADKQWRYTTYFKAIKHQVRDRLDPPQAPPAGGRCDGRQTLLSLALTPDGRLVRVAIVEPCGVGQEDARLVAAFQAAQPFPPAPPQLVDADSGLVVFQMRFHHGNDSLAVPRSRP